MINTAELCLGFATIFCAADMIPSLQYRKLSASYTARRIPWCRIDSDEVLRSYIAVCAKHCAANIAERYNDGSTAHIDGMNAVNDLGVLSASELDFDEFSVDRAAAAVSKLDDSQREILFLRYCCELPVQDTAELFRVTQPEMSAKIRYALAALRYAINNDGGSDK